MLSGADIALYGIAPRNEKGRCLIYNEQEFAPILVYVLRMCADLLPSCEVPMISERATLLMGNRLKKALRSGVVRKAEENFKNNREEFWLYFTEENVKRFMEFMIHSGGFTRKWGKCGEMV